MFINQPINIPLQLMNSTIKWNPFTEIPWWMWVCVLIGSMMIFISFDFEKSKRKKDIGIIIGLLLIGVGILPLSYILN